MCGNPGHDSELLSPEWLALDCGQELKSPQAFCLPRRDLKCSPKSKMTPSVQKFLQDFNAQAGWETLRAISRYFPGEVSATLSILGSS